MITALIVTLITILCYVCFGFIGWLVVHTMSPKDVWDSTKHKATHV